MGDAKREKEKKGEGRKNPKEAYVTARDVRDQWQEVAQAQPAAGVAMVENGVPFIV